MILTNRLWNRFAKALRRLDHSFLCVRLCTLALSTFFYMFRTDLQVPLLMGFIIGTLFSGLRIGAVHTQGPESLCQMAPPPSYRWMGGQAAAERWRIGVGTGRQLLIIIQLMAVANDNPFSFTASALLRWTCRPSYAIVA